MIDDLEAALQAAEQRAERAEADRDLAIEQRDISTRRANDHMHGQLAAEARVAELEAALRRIEATTYEATTRQRARAALNPSGDE